MVAYSFNKRFVNPIRAGLGLDGWPNGELYLGTPKLQTIRGHRQRHARQGEIVQHYCGMRTKQCFLIGCAVCIDVVGISIHFRKKRNSDWLRNSIHGKLDRPDELNQFATLDGFNNWQDLRAFWREEHPDVDDFEGVLIRWKPL